MRDPDSEETAELIGAGSTVLEAGPDAAGQRLDQWLAAKLGAGFFAQPRPGADQAGRGQRSTASRSTEPKRKLAAGDAVAVDLPEPEPAEPQGEDIPLDILYEDDELIVINKPAGLVVHPGAGNWTGTLVNALIHHCGDSLSGIGGVKRPGIVHRLDKETIGRHGRRQDRPRPHARCRRPSPTTAATGDWNAPISRWSGASRHGRRARSTRRSAAPPTACAAPWCRQAATTPATRSPITPCWSASARSRTARPPPRWSNAGWKPAAPTRSASTWPISAIRVVGDPDYGQAFRTKANRLPEPLRSDGRRIFRARRCMRDCLPSRTRLPVR